MIMLREFHNKTISFFEARKDLKFLSLEIEDPNAKKKIAAFLNVKYIPWELQNKGVKHIGEEEDDNNEHFVEGEHTDSNVVVGDGNDAKTEDKFKIKKAILPHEIIINVGMPKSGTSSLDYAFEELKISTAHQEFSCSSDAWEEVSDVIVGGNSTEKVKWGRFSETHHCYPPCCFIGAEIQRAISLNLPPLHLPLERGYRAFTQLDICYPDKQKKGLCVFPQVDALENIVNAYPHAFYIYTHRANFSAHAVSIRDFHGMLGRFKTVGYLNRWNSQSNRLNGK